MIQRTDTICEVVLKMCPDIIWRFSFLEKEFTKNATTLATQVSNNYIYLVRLLEAEQ